MIGTDEKWKKTHQNSGKKDYCDDKKKYATSKNN